MISHNSFKIFASFMFVIFILGMVVIIFSLILIKIYSFSISIQM